MKTTEEIKAKLLKLFAMMEEGSGASEQEVQTASVKARKLMAEYKLSEKDIVQKVQEVISRCFGNITFTSKTNPWTLDLLHTVADNYCCHACMYSTYHSGKKSAGLIGFEEDVETAGRVLNYAVDSITAEQKKIRKDSEKKGYRFADGTAMCNAYGNGFVRGLRDAFEEQNQREKETGFAMVMVEPQEVKDYVKGNCKKGSFNSNASYSAARRYDGYAAKGYQAGKNFNTGARITG